MLLLLCLWRWVCEEVSHSVMEALFCGFLVGWFREKKGLEALRGSGRTRESTPLSSTCRKGWTQERPWDGRALELSEHPSKFGNLTLLHTEQILQDLSCLQPLSNNPPAGLPPKRPLENPAYSFFCTIDALPGCTHPRLAGLHHPPRSGDEQQQVSHPFWVTPILAAGKGWVRRRSRPLSAPQELPVLTWNEFSLKHQRCDETPR